ncbi:ubiquinone/menaquinone biosynthesis methylase [Fulvivirga imtechensis AK7]|uniref:Ubiquinone/menaquinone biosynthesis methylase n=1 Tax=Fulvivirga imtechensis AK7 TaxID=1237149 RepID=L8JHU7_9BACT|nr:class I SAM-dependent methyltransferase [Fulvivirga imtechensis]ELR68441.1 ubiquinone/menaquinone biosynthesis methylase [Fulvivirga imtechensis AK7]
MNKGNFNTVAFIYDKLAGLVFGRSIIYAQVCHLRAVQPGSHILIVGGGTGWILEELDQLKMALAVTYVEPSSAMICRAMKRQPFKYIHVDFISAGYDGVSAGKEYDILITNFFLDLFKEEHLDRVLKGLYTLLKPNGLWLVTDFVNTDKYWQKALVRAMYVFFRLTTQIEADCLQDYATKLVAMKMSKASERQFYHGMIKSWLFVKPLTP